MRVPSRSLLLCAALLAAACGDSADADTCLSNQNIGSGVDGGVSCGQAYALNPTPGERDRFAVKVVQYLHMSSAGLVETDTIGSAIGWAEFVHEPGIVGLVQPLPLV